MNSNQEDKSRKGSGRPARIPDILASQVKSVPILLKNADLCNAWRSIMSHKASGPCLNTLRISLSLAMVMRCLTSRTLAASMFSTWGVMIHRSPCCLLVVLVHALKSDISLEVSVFMLPDVRRN